MKFTYQGIIWNILNKEYSFIFLVHPNYYFNLIIFFLDLFILLLIPALNVKLFVFILKLAELNFHH